METVYAAKIIMLAGILVFLLWCDGQSKKKEEKRYYYGFFFQDHPDGSLVQLPGRFNPQKGEIKVKFEVRSVPENIPGGDLLSCEGGWIENNGFILTLQGVCLPETVYLSNSDTLIDAYEYRMEVKFVPVH